MDILGIYDKRIVAKNNYEFTAPRRSDVKTTIQVLMPLVKIEWHGIILIFFNVKNLTL